MNAIEITVQAQMRMEDGSMAVVNTPVLVPSKTLTVDDVRELLMSLGTDPSRAPRADRIFSASGPLAKNLKIFQE